MGAVPLRLVPVYRPPWRERLGYALAGAGLCLVATGWMADRYWYVLGAYRRALTWKWRRAQRALYPPWLRAPKSLMDQI